MKVARFRVATCEGFSSGSKRGAGREPGISATVCDTLRGWKEIKTYRSEDRVYAQGMGARRGREGALRDAEDHAAYLNEWHRRELHRLNVQASRVAIRAEAFSD